MPPTLHLGAPVLRHQVVGATLDTDHAPIHLAITTSTLTKVPVNSTKMAVADGHAAPAAPFTILIGDTDVDYTVTSVASSAAWSSATAYGVGDLVTSASKTYACVKANTNQLPPNATYWVLATTNARTLISASYNPSIPAATTIYLPGADTGLDSAFGLKIAKNITARANIYTTSKLDVGTGDVGVMWDGSGQASTTLDGTGPVYVAWGDSFGMPLTEPFTPHNSGNGQRRYNLLARSPTAPASVPSGRTFDWWLTGDTDPDGGNLAATDFHTSARIGPPGSGTAGTSGGSHVPTGACSAILGGTIYQLLAMMDVTGAGFVAWPAATDPVVWGAGVVYAAGDFVMVNGAGSNPDLFYMAKLAHTASSGNGPPNSTYWKTLSGWPAPWESTGRYYGTAAFGGHPATYGNVTYIANNPAAAAGHQPPNLSYWELQADWRTNRSTFIAYDGTTFSALPLSFVNDTTHYNTPFQQCALATDSSYLYVLGTTNGRSGDLHVARVALANVLTVTSSSANIEYWNGTTWVAGNAGGLAAVATITLRGNSQNDHQPVGEFSVGWSQAQHCWIACLIGLQYVDLSAFGGSAFRYTQLAFFTSDDLLTWSAAQFCAGIFPGVPFVRNYFEVTGGSYAPMLDPASLLLEADTLHFHVSWAFPYAIYHYSVTCPPRVHDLGAVKGRAVSRGTTTILRAAELGAVKGRAVARGKTLPTTIIDIGTVKGRAVARGKAMINAPATSTTKLYLRGLLALATPDTKSMRKGRVVARGKATLSTATAAYLGVCKGRVVARGKVTATLTVTATLGVCKGRAVGRGAATIQPAAGGPLGVCAGRAVGRGAAIIGKEIPLDSARFFALMGD